jgi:hypothetical protein
VASRPGTSARGGRHSWSASPTATLWLAGEKATPNETTPRFRLRPAGDRGGIANKIMLRHGAAGLPVSPRKGRGVVATGGAKPAARRAQRNPWIECSSHESAPAGRRKLSRPQITQMKDMWGRRPRRPPAFKGRTDQQQEATERTGQRTPTRSIWSASPTATLWPGAKPALAPGIRPSFAPWIYVRSPRPGPGATPGGISATIRRQGPDHRAGQDHLENLVSSNRQPGYAVTWSLVVACHPRRGDMRTSELRPDKKDCRQEDPKES